MEELLFYFILQLKLVTTKFSLLASIIREIHVDYFFFYIFYFIAAFTVCSKTFIPARLLPRELIRCN